VVAYSLLPLIEMHVYFYDYEHDYIMIMCLPYNIDCYLACSSSG
jgi:hypothetical protein